MNYMLADVFGLHKSSYRVCSIQTFKNSYFICIWLPFSCLMTWIDKNLYKLQCFYLTGKKRKIIINMSSFVLRYKFQVQFHAGDASRSLDKYLLRLIHSCPIVCFITASFTKLVWKNTLKVQMVCNLQIKKNQYWGLNSLHVKPG